MFEREFRWLEGVKRAAFADELVRLHGERLRRARMTAWAGFVRATYRPDQVLPFIAPDVVAHPVHPIVSALSLSRWVHKRVRYARDSDAWGVDDFWQEPLTTLVIGQGDCEDHAIVALSAAPILNLPRAELVVGTVHGEGHAWVELPTIGILLDATAGTISTMHPYPHAYRPTFWSSPDGRARYV